MTRVFAAFARNRLVSSSPDVATLANALLNGGRGYLTEQEIRAIRRIAERVQVGDVNATFDGRSTFGQRLADRVAAVGGSWTFVISFIAVMVGWASINLALANNAFDPYPFIFLNLLLSMLAAIQAPIIMMSQNRQAAKDRLASEMDRETNLRVEVEIMALHEKFDRLKEEIQTNRAKEAA
jgi:uncharacterized membrane protein